MSEEPDKHSVARLLTAIKWFWIILISLTFGFLMAKCQDQDAHPCVTWDKKPCQVCTDYTSHGGCVSYTLMLCDVCSGLKP